jgi:hypothetical protein
MEIANDPKAKNSDRITAYALVLDRGWGRPHQSIDIEAVVNKKWTEMTLEDIYALERLKPVPIAPPPLIEGEVLVADLVEESIKCR